jgi:hypothetical protein
MRRALLAAAALAALLVGVVPAQAADPVYLRDPLSNRLVQHPRTISFGDAELTRLKWHHWGARRATATGRASVLVCEPSCGAGHRVHGKVTVHVRHRVRGHGRRVYRCIEGTVRGVPASVRRISWQC